MFTGTVAAAGASAARLLAKEDSGPPSRQLPAVTCAESGRKAAAEPASPALPRLRVLFPDATSDVTVTPELQNLNRRIRIWRGSAVPRTGRDQENGTVHPDALRKRGEASALRAFKKKACFLLRGWRGKGGTQ